MKDLKVKGPLERGAAADLWRNTLSRIPSVFGRLVYLSSLRDPNTGRYEHHGLGLVFGDRQADIALQSSHTDTFLEWLCYDLEQQKADLNLYLSDLPELKKTVLDTWLRLAPYRNLLPGSASDVEKRVYLSDLEALLAVLRNEYGVADLDPDA